MGNEKTYNISYFHIAAGLLWGAVIFHSVFRIFSLNRYAASWDAVDFALGVIQFDLLQMQPHFPGYPYFILGGMLLNPVLENPVLALEIWNIILAASSFYPIYRLAAGRLPEGKRLIAAVLVYTLSYPAVLSVQPLSDSAALSVLWWFLWSLEFSGKSNRSFHLLLPAFIFSILMGIRLSYLPFGIGLVLLWRHNWKNGQNHHKMKRLVYHVAAALVFQLVWVGGLIFNEGSVRAFLGMAAGFTSGHFSDWGGAATATGDALPDRAWQLIVNILWSGIAGESLYMLIGVILLVQVSFWSFFKEKRSGQDSVIPYLHAILFGSYFIWALFAQNVDKPRHAAPLAILTAFHLFIVLLKGRTRFPVLAAALFLSLQLWTGSHILERLAGEVPATYQLASYLDEVEEPFIVYTWEEKRVMDYTGVRYPYKRTLTYDYFEMEVSRLDGRRIFLTGHVAEGFRQQGADVDSHLKKVETFNSSSLVLPVYHKITLYEWQSSSENMSGGVTQ
ncbi:hypothetical protein [Bacillus marinisedimentorum]|uniref:hypothetical protein n=1 Tax=Bacillus marinisedimentorum TaxID=1821260 RepID=UPI000872C8A4|nr:hypothetical protein [Bacillus marinisedimentorum]